MIIPPHGSDHVGVIVSWLPGPARRRGGVPMYSWVVPILPYLDSQEMSDQWTMWVTPSGRRIRCRFVLWTRHGCRAAAGQASQLQDRQDGASEILQCPDDNTVQIGQGNLSYVVNGGFSLCITLIPAGLDPARPMATRRRRLRRAGRSRGASGLSLSAAMGRGHGVTQKLGVMFLRVDVAAGRTRAEFRGTCVRSMAGIADGASNTIMMSENTLAGVGGSSPYPDGPAETNWACPLPNFSVVHRVIVVCAAVAGTRTDCTAGNCADVQPQ